MSLVGYNKWSAASSSSFTDTPFSFVLDVDNFLENTTSTYEALSIPMSICSGEVSLQLGITFQKYDISPGWPSDSNQNKGEFVVNLYPSVSQDVYFANTKLDINNSSYYNNTLKGGNQGPVGILIKNNPEKQKILTFTTKYESVQPSVSKYSSFPENHPGRKFSTTISGVVILGDVKETTVPNGNNLVLQKSRISDNFLSLLETSKYSNIEISVGENNFSAHKCILTSRSPGFARIIEELETKSNPVNIITINDFSADVVKEGLLYIYTGCTSPGISTVVFELMMFAGKYEVEDLKSVCETEIKGSVTVDTVCHFLDLAHKCNAVELQEFCNNFIIGNIKDVMATDGWKELKVNNANVCVSLFEACISIKLI